MLKTPVQGFFGKHLRPRSPELPSWVLCDVVKSGDEASVPRHAGARCLLPPLPSDILNVDCHLHNLHSLVSAQSELAPPDSRRSDPMSYTPAFIPSPTCCCYGIRAYLRARCTVVRPYCWRAPTCVGPLPVKVQRNGLSAGRWCAHSSQPLLSLPSCDGLSAHELSSHVELVRTSYQSVCVRPQADAGGDNLRVPGHPLPHAFIT
ncbi:hypothetical protein C8Q73DRAFT_524893 [Cubamyces lactineus]|nr:hypothetical protein C8Q73DRAFT_524893 [Cubamyces lactineus]